jgi:hypothetical protein
MPRVGFKPTIPVFERAKTVHALDRTTNMICHLNYYDIKIGKLIFYYGWLRVTIRATRDTREFTVSVNNLTFSSL